MKEKYGDERVSKYILLRPNQDQLRKMQLQLLAGNWPSGWELNPRPWIARPVL